MRLRLSTSGVMQVVHGYSQSQVAGRTTCGCLISTLHMATRVCQLYPCLILATPNLFFFPGRHGGSCLAGSCCVTAVPLAASMCSLHTDISSRERDKRFAGLCVSPVRTSLTAHAEDCEHDRDQTYDIDHGQTRLPRDEKVVLCNMPRPCRPACLTGDENMSDIVSAQHTVLSPHTVRLCERVDGVSGPCPTLENMSGMCRKRDNYFFTTSPITRSLVTLGVRRRA